MIIYVTIGSMVIGCMVFIIWWIRFMSRFERLQKYEDQLNKDVSGEIIFIKKGIDR